MHERGTIVGVATGSPDGGLAVVRLSGPEAVEVIERLCGTLPPARRLVRRGLSLGDGGEEDALVVFMPGPASYTGEDVVELHVHGGRINVAEVLEACVAAGARPAGPGDFTRRAFEHGRMTLAQSEGVAALIGAETRAAADQARRLVAGELGEQVKERAAAVARLRVEVEAYLDFPDDVDDRITADWLDRVQDIASTLEAWLESFESARRAREIPRVVLAGPPNAGKSSLLNALLGRERSIVTELPGTTRDFVEARLELGRHAVELVDTAGLREAVADRVERAGVERALEQAGGADLLLWLWPADAQAMRELPAGLESVGAVWRIQSKADLGSGERSSAAFDHELSVARGEGVQALREKLELWVGGRGPAAWVGLARHRDRAQEAAQALAEAQSLLEAGAEVELVAFSLQVAQQRLDAILGRSELGPVGAQVLDAIFSTFCIGK